MATTGRICGECGDIGHIEDLVACSVCKIAFELTYFVQAPAPNQQGLWYCQTCRKKQSEMTEKRKSDKAGPTKKFENSKVKFLSSDEVLSVSRGTVRQCIKMTTTPIASSIQTALPSGTPTRARTSMAKSAKRLLSSKKMLFREPGNASSSGSKEIGHKLSSLKGQLPSCLAPITWKVSLEVHDSVGSTLVELVAYSPPKVSDKLRSAIEALPTKLQMKMVPRFRVWPKQFETDFPNLEDIGVYLLPLERRSGLKCTHLFRQLYSREHVLNMNVNAHLELVVHSSQILPENSQRIGGNLFFWGLFWKPKMRSCSKKKKFTSSDITPSKPSLELGASLDFRTPIVRDKTTDALKHNQVDKLVIADISDVCEKSSWEEVVADTLDIPPGFARPCIRQEISPMDKKSKTSMRGKETQPVYKDVVPRCSSLSYITNKGSGRRRLFSSIGVGVLEATIEGCENEEEKNVQQLETPPGFGTLGPILIKHEKPLVTLPVGLEIPPGFPRRVEAREEKNISNECKGSPLFMNQVLNVPRSVPTKFMDRPLLENQGIVHQQTPVGQRTVVFSYPVIQGTTSQSCSAQPTSPGGIQSNTSMLLFQETSHGRAIPEVSLNHSQTIQEPANHIQNYSEHRKRTSIMHATGEKQRAHSSFTTPNMKPKAFESPVIFLTQTSDVRELYPEMRPKEASKNTEQSGNVEEKIKEELNVWVRTDCIPSRVYKEITVVILDED